MQNIVDSCRARKAGGSGCGFPPLSPSENLIFRHKFSPFLSSVSLKTE